MTDRGDKDMRRTNATEQTATRSTVVVAALTLLSRVTGFARVITIAAVLGVNRFSDLYQSLNLLPNYGYELLAGSLITALLVPPLVRHFDLGDLQSMRRIAGGFLTLVVLAGAVAAVAVILAGALVVKVLTIGTADPALQDELLRLGWPLLALVMPQVVFYVIAALGAAVQNAAGRFALAAGAPVVENVLIMAVLAMWGGLFGTGIDSVAGVGIGQTVFLGAGTTFAVAVHAALQWFGAARCGVPLLPRPGWRDPEVRKIVSLAIPSAGYAGLNTIRLGAFLVAAGLVTGGQTVFLIALNFFNLPVALTSKPLSTTAMPALARLRQTPSRFARSYLDTLGLLLLVVIPASAMLAGLALPTAELGLWGTASTPEATTLLAASIAAVAFAVPGESIFFFSTNASYAMLDARSPLRAMVLRLAITCVCLALVAGAHSAFEVKGWQILAGIGAALAISDGAGAIHLARRIVSGASSITTSLTAHLAAGGVVLAITGSFAIAARSFIDQGKPEALATVAGGAVLGVIGAVVVTALHPPSVLEAGLGPGASRWLAAAQSLRNSARGPAEVARRLTGSQRPATATPALALLLVAVIAGAAISAFGAPGAAGVAGLTIVAAVTWRPVLGPLLLLATTPLTVGLLRGATVPFLRVNEVLLLIVTLGMAAHVVIGWRRGRRASLPGGGLAGLDWAMALLVLTGSVIPVLMLFGRGRAITTDDLVHGFVIAKFGLLYVVVRYGVRSRTDVRRCLMTTMVATVPVAFLALGQSLQVPGVAEALRPWLDQPPQLYIGRGAGTIGNSIALGDVMALHLALTLMLLLRHLDRRPDSWSRQGAGLLFASMAGVLIFGVGALGSGQFSGLAAAIMAIVVVIVMARRPRILLGIPAVGAIGAVALWPVLSLRLQDFDNPVGLPQSWQARIENLQTFFLPTLRRDFNWALGVGPDTSVDNPNELTGETFIESGFLWLLWVGGLLLLATFALLMVVALRRFATVGRSRDPWMAAVGGGGAAATVYIMVLTLTDPHLTLRGHADVYFPLLALSLLAAPELARRNVPPPIGRSARSAAVAEAPALPQLGWARYSPFGAGVKRVVDIVAGSFLLVAMAPLFAVVAVAVRVDSPGPVLFKQRRVGFAEREFTILKFRTMRNGCRDHEHRAYVQAMLREESPNGANGSSRDRSGPFKLTDDERVTTVGAFLRRTSLDELPQLLNVLRGDMSLVGPRPSLAYELSEFTPEQRLRATSVPGMTGLWQVRGRNELHMKEALELDLHYVRTCSFGTDLSILAKTALVVGRGSGA